MTDTTHTPAGSRDSRFQIVTDRGFMDWLDREQVSLALTTYQQGGLLLLGRKPSGELSIFASAFDRAMGLWGDGQTLWLSTAFLLWRLENSVAPGQDSNGFDRVYVPRLGYTTGDLDIHDVAVDADGRPVFVNTRFGCLAMPDDHFNFRPLWKPPFLSSLAPEDRCHLNGMALVDGRPRYVTLAARCDVADGWRDFRIGGGLVMDVTINEVVGSGLTMPHSPRWHQGRLWLLEAGSGHLGFLDAAGKFQPVAFVPGFARGLAIHGRYAVVGTSKPRREHAFQGLPLEKSLVEKGAAARAGLFVIELETGAVVHWARIESVIEELYDVVALPGVVRPRAMSFASEAIGHQFTVVEEGRWQQWSSATDAKGRLQVKVPMIPTLRMPPQ